MCLNVEGSPLALAMPDPPLSLRVLHLVPTTDSELVHLRLWSYHLQASIETWMPGLALSPIAHTHLSSVSVHESCDARYVLLPDAVLVHEISMTYSRLRIYHFVIHSSLAYVERRWQWQWCVDLCHGSVPSRMRLRNIRARRHLRAPNRHRALSTRPTQRSRNRPTQQMQLGRECANGHNDDRDATKSNGTRVPASMQLVSTPSSIWPSYAQLSV